MSTFKGQAITTIGTTYAMYKAIQALSDAYNLSYDSAIKNTSEHLDELNSTKSEIENLKSQAEEYKDTLSSLGEKYEVDLSGIDSIDDKISALQNIGKLELIDQVEIDKISEANNKLESQLSIKERLSLSQQKEAAHDAKDTLNRGKQSVAQQVAQQVPGGKKTYQGMVNNVNVATAVKEDIAAIEKYEDEISKLEKSMSELDPKSKEWKQSEKDIASYNKAIEKLTEDLDSKEVDLDKLLSATSVNGEGLESLKGFEDEFNEVKSAYDAIGTMGLLPAEKELNSLDSFFSSTTGNAIGDYLNNIVAESGNAEDALNKFKELGLSLDDIGVSQDSFIKYFQDVAKSAEQAKEKASAVGTTLSDVDAAFESENQDASWKKFADYATQARDLAKQDKWGTDDLQKSIEWVLPKFDVEKQLKKNGGEFEYVADVYEKKYKDAEKLYKRYFDPKNPKDSAVNFQNDLIDKGLLKEDETGLTGTFDNTAQAAKKMNMSIEATEALLHNLESYGFEWDDVTFSGENFKDYETALNKIKDLRDSMDEGETKKKLDDLIDGEGGWEEQYQKYQDDLSELSKEQIVHIEFEYSLASIQSEIDKTMSKIEAGDKSVENYANVIAGNDQYINAAKKGVGLDNEEVELPVILETTENTIEDLQHELKNASDDEKLELQAELANKQELEKSILNSFSDQNPEITPETDPSEINKAWDRYLNKEQHITVDAELNDIDVRSKLSNLEAGSTITYTANVDGVQTVVTAVKNEDGTISYTADVGDAEQKVNTVRNEDGTITYTVKEVEGAKVTKADNKSVTQTVNEVKGQQVSKEAAPATQIVNQKLGDLVPTVAPAASQAVNRYVANSVSTEVPSATQKVIRVYEGSGALNGTAHKEGTAKDKTSATLPLSKKGVSKKTDSLYPIPKLSRRALAMGTLDDETRLNPNWKTKKSEDALTGELGQEMVVNGNRWWTVGDNGAEFTHIPKGSVVFNAKQTKELLSKGFTPSRGTARLSGTAHLEGTAYVSDKGGNKLTSSSSSKKKNTTKSSNSKTKKKGKGKGTTKKDTKKFKETFDWIEVAIDRIERAIDSLDLKASSVYRSWSDRNKKLKSEISKVSTEITKQKEGFKRYNKQADKVSKSAKANASKEGFTKSTWNSLTKKVREGKIDINTIKNEKLAERIKEYQQWWNFHAT